MGRIRISDLTTDQTLDAKAERLILGERPLGAPWAMGPALVLRLHSLLERTLARRRALGSSERPRG
jgi:hypothetical protein